MSEDNRGGPRFQGKKKVCGMAGASFASRLAPTLDREQIQGPGISTINCESEPAPGGVPTKAEDQTTNCVKQKA